MENKSLKNILVVNLSLIGDVILSTPVIRNLKLNYPDASIRFLTVPWSKEVVANNPYLDEVIVYDKHNGDKGLYGLIKISKIIKRYSFDLSVIVNKSFGSALICFLARIPQRISYAIEGRNWLLSQKIKFDENLHLAENHIRLLALLNIKNCDRRLDFSFTNSDLQYIDNLLNKDSKGIKPLIGINPSASWETKRWGVDKYIRLANMIKSEFDVDIAFIGSKMDEKVVNSVVENLNFECLNLLNKTTLPQLGAFLSKCKLFITNDTGPMHLAVAVGTPVVAVFGPTSPSKCGPFYGDNINIQSNLACINCYKKKCDSLKCMDSISVERVFEAVKFKIKSKS